MLKISLEGWQSGLMRAALETRLGATSEVQILYPPNEPCE